MLDRRFRVRTGEIAAEVDDTGEALLIDLSSGVYYSLQEVGALVWTRIEQGYGIDAITDELVLRFGIERARAVGDVDQLVEQLLAERIIEEIEIHLPSPSPREVGFTLPAVYETPLLEKFDDMSDLLAMDPPMPDIADQPWESPVGEHADGS